jgi:hypothetical protein
MAVTPSQTPPYTGPGKLSGWGYPSQLPCAVCGQHTPHNQAEPRFYYTVCPAHQHVPPTQIHGPQ